MQVPIPLPANYSTVDLILCPHTFLDMSSAHVTLVNSKRTHNFKINKRLCFLRLLLDLQEKNEQIVHRVPIHLPQMHITSYIM